MKATEYLLYNSILHPSSCGVGTVVGSFIRWKPIRKQPYLCSHCLNIFKVASVLLKCDGPLVEEPLERHIQ